MSARTPMTGWMRWMVALSGILLALGLTGLPVVDYMGVAGLCWIALLPALRALVFGVGAAWTQRTADVLWTSALLATLAAVTFLAR